MLPIEVAGKYSTVETTPSKLAVLARSKLDRRRISRWFVLGTVSLILVAGLSYVL